MANKTIKGTGTIVTTDFKTIKFVGKTKSGKAVTIQLDNAINKDNIDWTFVEKDDVVAKATFEGSYDNTDNMSDSNEEPWTITVDDSLVEGASEIMLGAGLFYIGSDAVALTRGGSQFTVEREYREINADGDRGTVKDRVEIVSSRPKLTLNALTFLTRVADIYPAVSVE